MALHADVNIARIEAVMFGVRQRDEERKNTEHQDDGAEDGQNSHGNEKKSSPDSGRLGKSYAT